MIEDLEENEFEENDFDQALRPKGFDDFQGQDQIVDNLKVFIEAAKEKNFNIEKLKIAWTKASNEKWEE